MLRNGPFGGDEASFKMAYPEIMVQSADGNARNHDLS